MFAIMLMGLFVLSSCDGGAGNKGSALQGNWQATTNDDMDVTWFFDGKGSAEFCRGNGY